MPEKHLYEYAVIRIVPKVEREEFINKVCYGHKTGGTIAALDIPERFRWLTAMRSSCIQTSRPHVGFSVDLEETLDKLFNELVL